MTKVAVRPEATTDLADINRYVRRSGGLVVANDYRLEFRAVFRRLAAHPEIGSPRRALGRDVRLVVVDPYVVLHRYDTARDTVFVLRVLHGRRRLALDAP